MYGRPPQPLLLSYRSYRSNLSNLSNLRSIGLCRGDQDGDLLYLKKLCNEMIYINKNVKLDKKLQIVENQPEAKLYTEHAI